MGVEMVMLSLHRREGTSPPVNDRADYVGRVYPATIVSTTPGWELIQWTTEESPYPAILGVRATIAHQRLRLRAMIGHVFRGGANPWAFLGLVPSMPMDALFSV